MASAPNHMMDAAWVPCISSLPFSLPRLLFLLSLPSPLSPALYVSVWKQGRTWALSCPTTLSLYGCIICLPFLALTLYSHWHHIRQGPFSTPFFLLPSLLYSLFPFPCCCLHWHYLLLYPPEHSIHWGCKANAWDSLKQTASILCRSPICG